jgi:hypothetical protein
MPAKHSSNRPPANPTTPPRLYSYLRFSSPEQALGDSEQRQLEDAQRYATAKGLTFDETLADKGLSGYHGDHRTKGALGRFLLRVKAGDVPPGSILVIENVDRLSREGVWRTLKDVVFDLVERNITLHFLTSNIDFDKEAPNDWRCQFLISELQRAHAESARKSDLSRRNWRRKQQQAREAKRPVNATCPAWIKITDKGMFEVIPAAVETIRLIFQWTLQGLGQRIIEQKLNREAPWTPPLKKGGGRPRKDGSPVTKQRSRGWRTSYLRKILGNAAVTGIYQPKVWVRDEATGTKRQEPVGEPVPDYYPRVIPDELFHAVQARRQANGKGKGGGRIGKAHNLLARLVDCAYCDGPMAYVDKSAGARPGGSVRLVCDRGQRQEHQDGKPVCARHSMSYQEVEDLVLQNCYLLRPEQVLPNPDDQATRVMSLRQRVEGKTAELHDVEKQINNLVDQIARTSDRGSRDRYEAKVRELDGKRMDLQKAKGEEERQLQEAERSSSSFAQWQKDLATLREALANGDMELRLKMRAHLRELIDKIEVFAIGHKKRYDSDAERKVMDDYRQKLHAEGRTVNRAASHQDRELRRALDEEAGGETIDEALWALATDNFPDRLRDKTFAKQWGAFVDEMVRRRMSREGRFVRIWFRGGGVADLVPKGSLADGLELRGERCTFVRPEYGKLFEEFQQKRTIKGRKQ